MANDPLYQINKPKLVYETIEGETVIVDLATGSYFSLVGAGSIVWTELAAGRSPEEIIALLHIEYDAGPQEIETAVQTLVQELLVEQLVTLGSPLAGSLAPQSTAVNHHEPPVTKRKFQSPHLAKFSDMQELLLLDPVHDVDETGWPNTDNRASV